MKDSNLEPQQYDAAELEYYEIGDYTATDRERDNFFETLAQEDSPESDQFSQKAPVRLDEFYRGKKSGSNSD
jgi:hypothetical protein